MSGATIRSAGRASVLLLPALWTCTNEPLPVVLDAAEIRLAFTSQPTVTVAGTSIAPAVEVVAYSADSVATAFAESVTIALAPPLAAYLSGTTTVPAEHGVARFTDLVIDTVANGLRFVARAGGALVESDAFSTLSQPLPPLMLAFRAIPESTVAGDIMTPLEIVATRGGQIATDWNAQVIIAIDPPAPWFADYVLKGDTVGRFDHGVARFTNVWIERAGTYRLRAASAVAAYSSGLTVVAAPADRLEFAALPTVGIAGIGTDAAAIARDRFGNRDSTFTDTMRLAIASGPAGAMLSGHLVAPATRGMARFRFSVDRPGDYRLAADAAGITSLSSAFAMITNDVGWTALDLGTLGGASSTPAGLDASGRVIGWSGTAAGATHAFLFDSVMRDLGSGRATAIGATGLIAGEDAEHYAIVWENGTRRRLGTRQAPDGTSARAITAHNDVVIQYVPDGAHYALAGVFRSGGGETLLETSNGCCALWTDVYGANDAGTIVGAHKVGYYGASSFLMRPFVWRDGALRDLPVPFDPQCPEHGPAPCARGSAVAVNANGVIVGYALDSTGRHLAVRWSADTIAVLHPDLARYSAAVAINAHGAIIGMDHPESNHFGSSATRAFVWRGGAITWLGSLGGGGTVATAINDDGVIVGSSLTSSGQRHAFVWSGGRMMDLGAGPVALQSHAVRINARGDIIGCGVSSETTYWPGIRECRAILWRVSR